MGDDDTRDDDLDRAAILARRQRFIALALSGLATAGACTPTDAPPKDDSSRARPSACLKYSLEPRQPKPNAPPAPDATPTPCLAVPIDQHDSKLDPIPETDTAAPQVCLSAVPREPVKPSGAAPCLSVAPQKKPAAATPRPCLEVVAPGGDDD